MKSALPCRALLIDPLELVDRAPAGMLLERFPPEEARSRLYEGYEAGLIACDLGGERSGLDLLAAEVRAGSPVPLILLAPGLDERLVEQALEAGAAACLDPTRLEEHQAAWLIRFARANRRSAEQRNAQLLSGLAAYLVHEGRNALAGIHGAVQVVADHLPPGSPDRLLCGEIRERVARFAGSLEALTLALHPPMEPARRRVSLLGLIHEVARRLPSEVFVRVTGEEVVLEADPEQMSLLFAALLQNAAEAMDGVGQVAVHVDRQGDVCRVYISDSGPRLQVSGSDLSEMLDLFTTTKGVRAGLGLPVAKRVAEVHGGTLQLDVTSDCSLQVTIRLPVTDCVISRQSA